MHKLIKNPVFKHISQIAEKKACEVFVVGGYVRDLLLKRPSKDIDILVLGSGIDFAESVAENWKGCSGLNVFKNFGTAMLRYKDYEIEFVGARKESYRSHSRKPVVEDGSFTDDIARRDFTINAMAVALHPAAFGTLIDLYNGQDDLKNNVLRTPLPAEKTFYDDPLRMMRAVRFATQLNFKLHPQVLKAIKMNGDRLRIISQERITDELQKIIISDKPSTGFKLLFSTGLLHLFFPELSQMQGVEVLDKKAHKDNFFHTLEVLDKVSEKSQNIWLRWAAILHDIAKPVTKKYCPEDGWTFHSHEFIGEKMVKPIFRRLRLPTGGPLKYVQKLVRLHLRPIALTEDSITDSAVRRLLFDAGEDIDDLMLLCKADITSKNEAKVKRFLKNLEKVEQKMVEIEKKDHIRTFQPPVTGEIIMETFGIGPGREIGIIKNAIKDAILDGVITNTYEEAYDFMLKEAEKINLKPLK